MIRRRARIVVTALTAVAALSGCTVPHVTATHAVIPSGVVVQPTASASADPVPSETPQLGIDQTDDIPTIHSYFVAKNSWTGAVGGTYFTVYAGSDNRRAPEPAVAVFSDGPTGIGARELVEIVDQRALRGALRITGTDGTTLLLRSTNGQSIDFSVPNRAFTQRG